jgi:hypothetical protein
MGPMQLSRLACLFAIALIALPASPLADELILHDRSGSAQDLKLSGELPGVPANSERFVSYSDLSKLPQVTFNVTNDPNFPQKTEISGVSIGVLLRELNIPEKNTLVSAICDDEYEGHYSAEYRAAHNPILVLRINGKPPALSSRTSDGGIYGPYLISHDAFTPRGRVLGHEEESQIPNGVLELRFLKEDIVLKAIQPHGIFAADSPEMQGYEIARQSCFRCHNAGSYGGHKAGRSWYSLAKIAKADPTFFSAYTRNPQSQDSAATMPADNTLDDKALAAITAYFQTFATETGLK